MNFCFKVQNQGTKEKQKPFSNNILLQTINKDNNA